MRNNVNSIWTESLTADLTRLWSQGYSCAQIAAIIGCSRNAVIGRAHRLELPRHSRTENVNGRKRSINPKPLAEPRRGARARICNTVFKSRERKPANKVINTPPTPGLVQVISALTGIPITMQGFRRRRAPEMTKDEMRAMLTTAVQNTAAMEMAE